MKKYALPISISAVGLTLLLAGTVGTSDNSHFLDVAEGAAMFGAGALTTSILWIVSTFVKSFKTIEK